MRLLTQKHQLEPSNENKKRTGRLLAFNNSYRKLSDVYMPLFYKYGLQQLQCQKQPRDPNKKK